MMNIENFPLVDGINIKALIPNDFVRDRYVDILTTEPETIDWINSFSTGEVFWDVGANVGIYSIYAHLVKQIRVVAFEPEASNYYLLNKNIRLNELSDLIAYPAGLFSHTKLSKLFLSRDFEGWACNSIEQNVDPFLHSRQQAITQGSICIKGDDAIEVFGIDRPAYIKIDVDGFEHLVLEGMKNLLSSGHVKSLMVELNFNLDEHKNIVNYLADFGYIKDDEYIEKYTLKEGYFKGMCNVLFNRSV